MTKYYGLWDKDKKKWCGCTDTQIQSPPVFPFLLASKYLPFLVRNIPVWKKRKQITLNIVHYWKGYCGTESLPVIRQFTPVDALLEKCRKA